MTAQSPLGALASEGHFLDHLLPIVEALGLPVFARGEAIKRAAALGVDVIEDRPRNVGAVLVASSGDLRRARGFPTILAQHGAGQSYSSNHPSYPGGSGQERAGLHLVPNAHAAARTRAAYPHAEVAVVGCPKLDRTCVTSLHKNTERPVVAVSFHWDCYVAPETRSAWEQYRRAIPRLNEQFTVLGHGHPRIFDRIARFYERDGIEAVRDFSEVLARAEVYACDNSSTLFEFAATGRPVVVLHSKRYRREVNHGLRFWDASTVGLECSQPGELRRTVKLALADPPEQQLARDQALDLVYAFRDGTATERAVDAIAKWLTTEGIR